MAKNDLEKRTLNVKSDLQIRGQYASDLRINWRRTSTNSASWRAGYVPSEKVLTGIKRPKKEVRWHQLSLTDCTESGQREAGKAAINWWKTDSKEFAQKQDVSSDKSHLTLAFYWERYIKKFEQDKQKKDARGKVKDIRDEKNKWNSPTYGISKERFAHKPVDLILRSDYEAYFSGITAGTKAQQKTLIKKLLVASQDDFLGHSFPSFPSMGKGTTKKKSKREGVTHFEQHDWTTLLGTIVQLSGGVANREISLEEYEHLEWNSNNRQNQRNWVDLYDALWTGYYWFLRSEDMKRLRMDWFSYDKKIDSNGDVDLQVNCHLEEAKGYRDAYTTANYNDQAVVHWKRLEKRRSKEGWVILPCTPDLYRGDDQPENKVRNLLNFLLKQAVIKCLPDFDPLEANFTAVRHTAFRLHLECDQDLWADKQMLKHFADNGNTSVDMLDERYLNYLRRNITARKTRKKQKKNIWAMQIRA